MERSLFKQNSLTARTVEEALYWIETTPHHYAAVDEEPGFFVLKGRYRKLRVPTATWASMAGLTAPGDEFDRRMFRATQAGLDRLGRNADGSLKEPVRVTQREVCQRLLREHPDLSYGEVAEKVWAELGRRPSLATLRWYRTHMVMDDQDLGNPAAAEALGLQANRRPRSSHGGR